MENRQAQDEEPTRYAGFWLRVAANIIDSIILTTVFTLLGVSTGLFSAPPGEFFQYAYPGSIVFPWLYYALFESSHLQATIGKHLLHIKVTDMQGARATFARATGRHFGKILSGVILAIGYLMVAFTKRKQGLHDILAKTLVVRRNQ